MFVQVQLDILKEYVRSNVDESLGVSLWVRGPSREGRADGTLCLIYNGNAGIFQETYLEGDYFFQRRSRPTVTVNSKGERKSRAPSFLLKKVNISGVESISVSHEIRKIVAYEPSPQLIVHPDLSIEHISARGIVLTNMIESHFPEYSPGGTTFLDA